MKFPPPIPPASESKSLPADVYCRLCEHAVANLMLPEDAIRLAAGLSPIEPFLISPGEASGREEIDRFLGILAALWKKGRKRFEQAAPGVRGTKRVYFGRTAEEVYRTGSSNMPKKIPGCDWYVSSNNDGNRKAEIVYDLMCGMGFSSNYARMVSSLCYSDVPSLGYYYVQAYRKLKKD